MQRLAEPDEMSESDDGIDHSDPEDPSLMRTIASKAKVAHAKMLAAKPFTPTHKGGKSGAPPVKHAEPRVTGKAMPVHKTLLPDKTQIKKTDKMDKYTAPGCLSAVYYFYKVCGGDMGKVADTYVKRSPDKDYALCTISLKAKGGVPRWIAAFKPPGAFPSV